MMWKVVGDDGHHINHNSGIWCLWHDYDLNVEKVMYYNQPSFYLNVYKISLSPNTESSHVGLIPRTSMGIYSRVRSQILPYR